MVCPRTCHPRWARKHKRTIANPLRVSCILRSTLLSYMATYYFQSIARVRLRARTRTHHLHTHHLQLGTGHTQSLWLDGEKGAPE